MASESESGKYRRCRGQRASSEKSAPRPCNSGDDENSFLVEALNETAIVAVTDVKGRILHANDKFCEISGYSREELIGQDHRILKTDAHPTELFREMYRVIGRGEVWRGEFCNKAKCGRLYWVDTTIVPRRSRATGKVIGYTSIRVDITQRKLMEIALERSEALNRSTMMALSEGILVQDGSGAIIAANPAAVDILGLDQDPVTGAISINPSQHNIREDGCHFPSAEHPSIIALTTGEPQRGVVMGLRKDDGTLTWVAVNSVPVRHQDGNARSVVTSFSDITELLRSRQVLTESIEAIPDGFVAYDRDDRLVVCNEAYRTIYSASAPAMQPGTTFAEIIRFGLEQGQYPEAGTSDAERSAWLKSRLAQHALSSTDIVQQLSNGCWVQIRERRTANGYRVGFRTDITEVKQEAARLRAIIDNFPGGISMFNVDLKLIACNDEFRRLLDLPDSLFEGGLPPLEAIFRFNSERGEYGPGESEKYVQDRMELARRNEPYILELVRPNGIVLEVRGIPVPGGGFISTYVDVTERYQAAQRLAQSEQDARSKSETLQITLAHMSQGLSMFDKQDRLIVWNDRFAEIYRLPPSLLFSGTPSRAISAHLRDIEAFETDQPQWRKIIASGQGLTARLRSRDGRTIKVVYIPVSGSGWVATHEEVTDQILVQTKLAKQKEELAQTNMRLDAALDSMSQGLCLLDADGKVVLTNGRFRDMYLLSETDVSRGTPVKKLVQIFLERYALPDFSVEEFLTAIPDETSRLLQLSDGRIVHVRRASTPDGGWLAIHEDITEREQSARQIAHLAFHDPLTGLANRAKFHQKGEEILSQRANYAALLMIDLDRFKSVNDSFGHAAGDRLLKLAASRMSAYVRADDLLARIGGDEFAILLAAQDNPREAAISLAARLIEVLAHPFELEGRQALVGASIGISLGTDKADSIEALLHQADLALYEVKASGRNASLIYDDMLGARAHERLELETELRKAIEAGELELHYQPIVALQSRQVCGMEGLVRWRHPVRGLLLPDRFIQIAEDSGLIVPLGDFVVRQACADASRWPDHVKVAVNISPTHIKRRTLLNTVADALLQAGLEAERLEIEVTETVLMQQDEDIMSELHQLRHLGVSIALDDFGTGFSSLSHLRMFSFDKVKIDRTFIAEITERPDSAAIVCAVTGLARALNMTTTAEGIETEHQAQILLAAGCTQGQGYLFGKPQPTAHLSPMDCGRSNKKTVA